MLNKLFYPALGVFLVCCLAAHYALAVSGRPASVPVNPSRIVSLAPSLTETLYAMGLGEAVVGVTRFCSWPEAAAEKPKVAGFSDINYEAVLRLAPDLVVLPLDKARNRAHLENLGLTVLTLDVLSVDGLLESIAQLGAAAGRVERATALVRGLEADLTLAKERASGKPRPRVLFSVMHAYEGLGYIGEIHAVGRDGFYNALIEAAGGENVYDGHLAFPRLSREALIFLNPEVIIDVIPPGGDTAALRRDWESLDTVSAIKNGRLFLLEDEVHTVPGPRFGQTLRALSLAFHPVAADPLSGRQP